LDRSPGFNADPDWSKVTFKDAEGNAVGGVDISYPFFGFGSIKVTIAHAAFEYEKTYTVTIPKAAILGLTEDITWSFSTGKEPLADLIITNLAYTPVDSKTTDKLVFTATVKNIGTAPTEPLTDNWKIGVAFSVNGKLVNWSDYYNQTGLTIAPDQEVTLTAVGGPDGNGFWTAPKAGTYTLTAEVNDTRNIREVDYTNNTKEIPLTVQPGTSISNVATTGKVYSANGRLYVSGYPVTSTVAIYNVLGQAVSNQRITADVLSVDLPSGAYIVNIKSQGKTNIHKILVK
jgi:hypothetical protein